MGKIALVMLLTVANLFGEARTRVAPGVVTVTMDDQDTVPVYAKLRCATLIMLLGGENIEALLPGDKAFWQIVSHRNYVSVKPSRRSTSKVTESTDLHVMAVAEGGREHIYSFVLSEVGSTGVRPDLKVLVKDAPAPAAATPVVVKTQCDSSLAEAKGLLVAAQATLQQTTDDLLATRKESASKVDPALMVSEMDDYKISRQARREPFDIKAIYSEGGFTYIRSSAKEAPVVYELKDGKPNLITANLVAGGHEEKNRLVYVIPKVVDRGYLRCGKKHAGFEKKAGS